MTWSTVTLTVTTPLFNAGHVPHRDDEPVPVADAEVRVPSMLGAMRFWFRALAAAHVGPDLNALHDWEGRVFGRAAREGVDTASAPVQWRIRQQPVVTEVDAAHDWLPSGGKSAFDQGDDRWLVYLLGQGLGDLGGCTVKRPYVAPGEQIEVQFRIRRDDPTAVALNLAAFWLMCTYGGIGARTRRGFGGVRIEEVVSAPGLPAPWDQLSLVTAPTAPGFASATQVWSSEMHTFLRLFVDGIGDLGPEQATGRPERSWGGAPEFPALGPGPDQGGRQMTAAALGPTFSGWAAALAHSGRAWREMRATVPAKDARYPEPKVKTWEWLKVVWDSETDFELGAYGLPVVFKGGAVAQVIVNGEKARRASPVWMRPVQIGGAWRVFSFAFLTRLLPADGSVVVRLDRRDRSPKWLGVPAEFDVGLANGWFDQLSRVKKVSACRPSG
jgi:CRISPR-associated protein Cmr1